MNYYWLTSEEEKKIAFDKLIAIFSERGIEDVESIWKEKSIRRGLISGPRNNRRVVS